MRRPISFLSGPKCAVVSAAALLLQAVLVALPAASVPEVDLHDLSWHVHQDLINPGIGEDLAYWQGVIDEEVASANQLIEGRQGPFDTPCCARLTHTAVVTAFGSAGDGRDVLSSSGEQSWFNNFGSGSHAFLIDSITFCGGDAPGSIGCAELPGCGPGNDDPNLWMAVTVDSFDDGTLASVIAHERGHNACLPHVITAECQLMQGSVATPGLAGCMMASECADFQDGRTQTSSGLYCGCLDDFGGIQAEGTICPDVTGGICSGGLCGEITGAAGVHLIAAGHAGTASGGPADDAIKITALKGDWNDLGRFAPTGEELEGLAFAWDSGVLYGVVPSSGDDALFIVDVETGQLVGGPLATFANGAERMVGLAYDPGPTDSPTDDRILFLEATAGSGFPAGRIHWVDPNAPSTLHLDGLINSSIGDSFEGLAYDSAQGKLFSTIPFTNTLWEIQCDGSTCPVTSIPGDPAGWEDGSLSYSPTTGLLHLVGTAFGGQRTFYSLIDPTNGSVFETVSLDVFTPAALAAVPEPGLGTSLLAGIIGLAVAGRRRGGIGTGQSV